ncbi:MAG: hypothetical protein RMK45_09160, partial [Armatimonadota bacterium]|nr:hypothetical protein [Armatimonadota bacterium]
MVTMSPPEPTRETPVPADSRVAPRWRAGLVALAGALVVSTAANVWLSILVVRYSQLLAQWQDNMLTTMIPIKYSPSGHPIVPVQLNGETFWWQLDTGAARTVVFAERFPTTHYVRRVHGSDTLNYTLMGFQIRAPLGVV